MCQSSEGVLIEPCGCRGTIRYAHADCLLEWVRLRQDAILPEARRTCNVCRQPMQLPGYRYPYREVIKQALDNILAAMLIICIVTLCLVGLQLLMFITAHAMNRVAGLLTLNDLELQVTQSARYIDHLLHDTDRRFTKIHGQLAADWAWMERMQKRLDESRLMIDALQRYVVLHSYRCPQEANLTECRELGGFTPINCGRFDPPVSTG